MEHGRFEKWLHWLRVTATIIYIAALCLAVAVLVIDFIPHSPVPAALRATDVPGLDAVSGLPAGVTVDSASTIAVKIAEPSVAQRLLYLVVVLPGLALVALIAWRMAKLLRAALGERPVHRPDGPSAHCPGQDHRCRRDRRVGDELPGYLGALGNRPRRGGHRSPRRNSARRGSPLRSSSRRSANSSPAASQCEQSSTRSSSDRTCRPPDRSAPRQAPRSPRHHPGRAVRPGWCHRRQPLHPQERTRPRRPLQHPHRHLRRPRLPPRRTPQPPRQLRPQHTRRRAVTHHWPRHSRRAGALAPALDCVSIGGGGWI